MPSGRIEVYARVKPNEAVDHYHLQFFPDQATIQVRRPARKAAVRGTESTTCAAAATWSDGINSGFDKLTHLSHNSTMTNSGCTTVGDTVDISNTGGRDDCLSSSSPQSFSLDRVFVTDGACGTGGEAIMGCSSASQESVYEATVRKMVSLEGVLGGTSATVLCYGAKATGKSYTIYGREESLSSVHNGGAEGGETRGLAQRAIADLYQGITELTDSVTSGYGDHASEFQVFLSMLQLQGERVVDLLATEHVNAHRYASGNSSSTIQRRNHNNTRGMGGANAGLVSTTYFGESGAGMKPSITLDGSGAVLLKNIRRRLCPTPQHAFTALREGLAVHRATPHRSYCHLIASLYVHQRTHSDSIAQTRHAVLHFVDLAGTQSQRHGGGGVTNTLSSSVAAASVSASMAAEKRHLASAVNKSLATLEQVVVALGSAEEKFDDVGGDGADTDVMTDESMRPVTATSRNGRGNRNRNSSSSLRGGGPRIAYRQSKLTTLLKGCMGGRCMTALIVHIKPDRQSLDATLSTLKFACRAMCVTAAPEANVVMDIGSQLRHLQRQLTDLRTVMRLQDQLSHNMMGASQTQATTRPLVPPPPPPPPPVSLLGTDAGAVTTTTGTNGADLQSIHEKVHAFVDGHTAVLQVGSVREMQACFSFLRDLLQQRDVRVAQVTNELAAVEASAVAAAAAEASSTSGLGNSSASRCGSVASSANVRKSVDGASSHRRGSSRRSPSVGGASSSSAVGGGAGRANQSSGAAASHRSGGRRQSGVYTPSVLDPSAGVGCGVVARANAASLTGISTPSLAPAASNSVAADYTWSGGPMPVAVTSALRGFDVGASDSNPPVSSTRSRAMHTEAKWPWAHARIVDVMVNSATAQVRTPSSMAASAGGGAGMTPSLLTGSPLLLPAGSGGSGGNSATANGRRPHTALALSSTVVSTAATGGSCTEGEAHPPCQPRLMAPTGVASVALPPHHHRHVKTSASASRALLHSDNSRPHTAATTTVAATSTPLGTSVTTFAYKMPPRKPLTADPTKAAAFEVYKRSAMGSAQLRALQADQAALATLQQRRAEFEARLPHAGLAASVAEGTSTPVTAANITMGTNCGLQQGEQGVHPSSATATTAVAGSGLAAGRRLQEQLRMLISEQTHMAHQVASRRTALLTNFEEWFLHRCDQSQGPLGGGAVRAASAQPSRGASREAATAAVAAAPHAWKSNDGQCRSTAAPMAAVAKLAGAVSSRATTAAAVGGH